jgi:hypothetical protein
MSSIKEVEALVIMIKTVSDSLLIASVYVNSKAPDESLIHLLSYAV